MSARLEGYKYFKDRDFSTKIYKDSTRLRDSLERFQKDSKKTRYIIQGGLMVTFSTRSLRSLRGHYAVTTRSLRGHYAVTTRSLRGHYAVTTRSLRGHYGHYAVTTRSLRSLLGHYGHYAVTTRSLRSLWSLRGHYAVTMVTTRSLRGHYGHYAVTTVTTRSLRSLRGHCGHHAALKSYIVTHSRLRKRLTYLQNGLFDLDIVAVGL